MANLIYFTFIASLFINFTFGSMTFFSVNNIFNLIEHGPLEASLILLPNSEDVIDPMFNNSLLEENVNKYLLSNMPNYVDKYSVSFLYLNEDGSYNLTEYSKTVKISLKAILPSFFKFEKAKIFSVGKSI